MERRKLPIPIPGAGRRGSGRQRGSARTRYEKIFEKNDEKINVMLLGASGCGKSTLINAVLGEESAPAGSTLSGGPVTRGIAVYENDALPFRLIDTAGCEFGLFAQTRLRRELRTFMRESIRNADTEHLVHMIWFCIDGTVRRIDPALLDYVYGVASDWKDVPVLLVITKSYSEEETGENVHMAREAIRLFNEKHRRAPLDVAGVLPVVAKAFPVSESLSILPRGLDELVLKTGELVPEAKDRTRDSVRNLDLKLKKNMAASVIAASAAGAAIVGAVPIPVADAAVLVPLQTAMLSSVARIYGVKDESFTNEIIDTILKVGGTTLAGRALLEALKGVPALNAAASLLNAGVAGAVTLAAGQICQFLFEKDYTGERSRDAVDWENEIRTLFGKYLPDILSALRARSERNGGSLSASDIAGLFRDLAEKILKNREV